MTSLGAGRGWMNHDLEASTAVLPCGRIGHFSGDGDQLRLEFLQRDVGYGLQETTVGRTMCSVHKTLKTGLSFDVEGDVPSDESCISKVIAEKEIDQGEKIVGPIRAQILPTHPRLRGPRILRLDYFPFPAWRREPGPLHRWWRSAL